MVTFLESPGALHRARPRGPAERPNGRRPARARPSSSPCPPP